MTLHYLNVSCLARTIIAIAKTKESSLKVFSFKILDGTFEMIFRNHEI